MQIPARCPSPPRSACKGEEERPETTTRSGVSGKLDTVVKTRPKHAGASLGALPESTVVSRENPVFCAPYRQRKMNPKGPSPRRYQTAFLHLRRPPMWPAFIRVSKPEPRVRGRVLAEKLSRGPGLRRWAGDIGDDLDHRGDFCGQGLPDGWDDPIRLGHLNAQATHLPGQRGEAHAPKIE
jgi:hypothetical protein